jgi:hypothetical protein
MQKYENKMTLPNILGFFSAFSHQNEADNEWNKGYKRDSEGDNGTKKCGKTTLSDVGSGVFFGDN